MVPAELKDFLIATTGASASFIGLLFVAMSFVADKSGKDNERVIAEKILAESSYIALLNVFFISLVALIPGINIGYVTLIMAVLGFSNSFRLVRFGNTIRAGKSLLGAGVVIYFFEAIYGLYMILHSHHTIGKAVLMWIVIALFSSALGRAWELTGVREH